MINKNKQTVVLLSGGVDSSTCLAMAVRACGAGNILAVNMYYGQRHDREMSSARDIANYYGVELMEMDLSVIFAQSDSSLLKHSTGDIPHGSYGEQLKPLKGAPISTYVPFRNGLMLAAAASIAVSVGAAEVYYGAHADDAAGGAYPDCTPQFTSYINKAINAGTNHTVSVVAPFIRKHKDDIVRMGLELGVPYELTWSCYVGGDKPCGQCGTCIDRQKAFEANGVKDPLL